MPLKTVTAPKVDKLGGKVYLEEKPGSLQNFES